MSRPRIGVVFVGVALAALLWSAGPSWSSDVKDAPPPNVDGLLVTCYRAGPLASWGIYDWDAKDARLSLVLSGGEHPLWSPRHDYWACYRNGSLWVQFMGGTSRLVPQTVGLNARRVAQPLGSDGRRIARLQEIVDLPWLEILDTHTLRDTPEIGFAKAQALEYPPPRDDRPDPLLKKIAADLGIDPNKPSTRKGITDMAASPDGSTVALVVQSWVPGVGVQRSLIYLWRWQEGMVSRLSDGTDNLLEVNPHFLGASGKIVFDTIDPTEGVRTTSTVDIGTGYRTLLGIHGADRGEVSTWVLACSPDGSKIALGTGPPRGWDGPLRLSVVSPQGDLLSEGGDTFGIWDAAWSPDSTRLAFIHCQSGTYIQPRRTTQENVMLSVIDLPTASRAILYSTVASDRRKDDPTTPYELAW